jgi:branched-chain amino acid transport system permease protein
MSERTFSVVRTTRASRAGTVVGVAALAVLVALPFWASSASLHTLIDALTLLALAQMWNLLAGYAGLVSIGQQAYIGLGAYGLFILGDKAGINPFLAVLVAALAATVIAVPTAASPSDFGGYFAIGTWVIAEVYACHRQQRGAGSGTRTTVSSAAGRARHP